MFVRRQRPVQASTPPLPYCEHQPPPIWKVNQTCIHFSTQTLQIPFHSPMVEWREVEPHLSLRRGDPPAQPEKRHQAFPSTAVIAFSKVVIPDPPPQIRESELQQSHNLVFGVIQFPHFAFASPEGFAAFEERVAGLDTTVHSGSALAFPRRSWLRARRVDEVLPTPSPVAGL